MLKRHLKPFLAILAASILCAVIFAVGCYQKNLRINHSYQFDNEKYATVLSDMQSDKRTRYYQQPSKALVDELLPTVDSDYELESQYNQEHAGILEEPWDPKDIITVDPKDIDWAGTSPEARKLDFERRKTIFEFRKLIRDFRRDPFQGVFASGAGAFLRTFLWVLLSYLMVVFALIPLTTRLWRCSLDLLNDISLAIQGKRK